MTKENDTLRERLLSHLPQPTNVTAYREGIDQLLKKQEDSLGTFTWTNRVLSICTFILAAAALHFAGRHDTILTGFLTLFAALFFLIILSEKPMLEARRQHIELLKEIKQVQVQLLELQLRIEHKSGQ